MPLVSVLIYYEHLQNPEHDQDRLVNRGGILLLEEKLRKDLPKVEKDLLQKLSVWESQHHGAFLVHGRRYTETINNRKQQTKFQREQERIERVSRFSLAFTALQYCNAVLHCGTFRTARAAMWFIWLALKPKALE